MRESACKIWKYIKNAKEEDNVCVQDLETRKGKFNDEICMQDF